MRALVAMSGGVDSSVAALLLARKYTPREIWGVHMVLNEDQCDIESRSCCSSKDAQDALTVAQQLDIQFDAIPFKTQFQEIVINYFIDEYSKGRTPIPCTLCNGYLKFVALVDYAKLVGATKLATGHYVRKEGDRLYIATDESKDQSYYLWQIKSDILPMLEFPLGDYASKLHVRAIAHSFKLAVSEKSDSQDICFIPGGDYRQVLLERRPDLFTPREGDILFNGFKIGTHNGYWNFTIGQRRGLPAHSTKLYVSRLDPKTNTVYVQDTLPLTSSFGLSDQNWHSKSDELWVRTSSRAPLTKCTVIGNRCITQEPVRAVPGQAAVFYTKTTLGMRLEGGAWINQEINETPIP